ncbi:uncharacterized protein ACA1_330340 [Acanthamoeba castellanii str. Neff]|uniref:INO80 complex subunit B-like conserved region domain-containing protein n=1 Tax=Acanthamoeba castellanii (strain ATCC 30010 / Neff) TaxID=1257118 RepID=L8GHA1_ACACF|nr:uncharacterized protein ACA1_330340 [Acanthamoeba castellanii str. Neff]ELR12470.1 hypothetical protein ACA1_330340 [Acanthamoeba castellanii str. Neff]
MAPAVWRMLKKKRRSRPHAAAPEPSAALWHASKQLKKLPPHDTRNSKPDEASPAKGGRKRPVEKAAEVEEDPNPRKRRRKEAAEEMPSPPPRQSNRRKPPAAAASSSGGAQNRGTKRKAEEEIDIVGDNNNDNDDDDQPLQQQNSGDEAKSDVEKEESSDDVDVDVDDEQEDESNGEEEEEEDEADSLVVDEEEDEEGEFGVFQALPQQRLTSRQRAIIDRRDRGEPDEQLLLSLPMGSKAKKAVTEEEQQKKAESALRRKRQQQRQAEEEKELTVRKLLSRTTQKKDEQGTKPERTLGVPSIRYVSKAAEASCSFPDEPAVDLTLALPTSSRTVPGSECVVCHGARAYLSRDHRPLCSSLECYRTLHANAQKTT